MDYIFTWDITWTYNVRVDSLSYF